MTPSNVQLANFAALRCFGVAATELEREVALDLIEVSPVLREAWLAQHQRLQGEVRLLERSVDD